jgi:hypothetical protein
MVHFSPSPVVSILSCQSIADDPSPTPSLPDAALEQLICFQNCGDFSTAMSKLFSKAPKVVEAALMLVASFLPSTETSHP